MKRIYIAGPMRGIPNLNFPEFFRVAALWEARGWEVVNPAQMDLDHGIKITDRNVVDGTGIDFKVAMNRDLPAVASCHAIALLKNWERSQGANNELKHARELGREVYDAETAELVDYQPLTEKL